MNSEKRVVIMVGSPKIRKSASDFMSNIFMKSFNAHGIYPAKAYVHSSIATEACQRDMVEAINGCDILIFCCPLYLDSPPYVVTRAMEILYENRRFSNIGKVQKLIVVSNGGYPEAHHNETALAIYRKFAEKAKFEFFSGLAVGMGALISLRLMQKLSFIYDKLARQIDGIVADVVQGRRPANKDRAFMRAAAFVPRSVYFWGSRIAAYCLGARNGAFNLYARPYGDT